MTNSAHATETWDYTLYVPHDNRTAAVARATLRAVLTLHDLPELIERAELLATELLSNALRHTDGPASMRLWWSDGKLRIGVWDTDPQPPHLREVADVADITDDETGRGLQLVTLCSDDWGWYCLGEEFFGFRGKYVWCELAGAEVAAVTAASRRLTSA
ncbi:ATP-binding protein [Streptomyces sp. NPDC057654]|uniref:ATP-binding protein n=1 Tax=Streptomyces sp. NPDC057654 TaxID=3346196 RepID=UPI0036866D02